MQSYWRPMACFLKCRNFSSLLHQSNGRVCATGHHDVRCFMAWILATMCLFPPVCVWFIVALLHPRFLPRNLCGVTYNLYASLNKRTTASNTLMRGGVAKFALGFPLAIVVLAYIFDSERNMDPDVENGIVNVARHSCRHLLNQLLPIVDSLLSRSNWRSRPLSLCP